MEWESSYSVRFDSIWQKNGNIMSRNNCFDLLRFIAAVMVVIYHHAGFMRYPLTGPGRWIPLDSIWVQMFISISGYLVAKSFISSRGFDQFFVKRCLRIFPALFVCSLVVVYVVIPFWEKNPLEYIGSEKTLNSFVNMFMLHGINVNHAENPYGLKTMVNSPLWTLAYEFLLYIFLGLALSINRSWITPALILLVSVILCSGFANMLKNSYFYGVQYWTFLRLGINFHIGVLLFMTVNRWNNTNYKVTMSIMCILVLYAFNSNIADLDMLGRMAISILTIVIGVSFTSTITSGRMDISYGTYIWSWPVQAVIVSNFDLPFWESLAFSLFVIFFIALLSRNTVEDIFLKMKPL